MYLRRLVVQIKLFISYDYKAFPVNLHFLDIVGVCPTTFCFDLKVAIFTEKRFQINNKQRAQKAHKKGQKKFFHFTDTNVYTNSVLLFHFFVN